VKAAADIYMPVTGEVVEVNEALRAEPRPGQHRPAGQRLVLQGAPHRHGRVRQLMDPPAYDALLKTL
jgi:glycine cleavage system H protein